MQIQFSYACQYWGFKNYLRIQMLPKKSQGLLSAHLFNLLRSSMGSTWATNKIYLENVDQTLNDEDTLDEDIFLRINLNFQPQVRAHHLKYQLMMSIIHREIVRGLHRDFKVMKKNNKKLNSYHIRSCWVNVYLNRNKKAWNNIHQIKLISSTLREWNIHTELIRVEK